MYFADEVLVDLKVLVPVPPTDLTTGHHAVTGRVVLIVVA